MTALYFNLKNKPAWSNRAWAFPLSRMYALPCSAKALPLHSTHFWGRDQVKAAVQMKHISKMERRALLKLKIFFFFLLDCGVNTGSSLGPNPKFRHQKFNPISNTFTTPFEFSGLKHYAFQTENSKFYLFLILVFWFSKMFLNNLICSFSSPLNWYLIKDTFLFRETAAKWFQPYHTCVSLMSTSSKPSVVCLQL